MILWRMWALLLAVLAAGIIVAVTSPARSHGDLSWPAEFKSANDIPCCTLNAVMGDCVRVSHETAMSLRIGSVITIDYPSGTRTTRINVIHVGPEPAICAPGCLFTDAGV